MSGVPVRADCGVAVGQCRSAVAWFTEHLAAVPESRVAVGNWTVRDVGAHLVMGCEAYTGFLGGAESPLTDIADLPALAEELMRPYAELSGPELRARLVAASEEFLTAAQARPPDSHVNWHLGSRMTPGATVAMMLGELAVHGRDVALAGGRRWNPPRAWAHTVFAGALEILPIAVEADRAAGKRACFDVRLRGDARSRAVLSFTDGKLEVLAPGAGRRVDCSMAADPWAFLLVFYRRVGLVHPVVRGQVLAWGRRPWLGLTMRDLLIDF